MTVPDLVSEDILLFAIVSTAFPQRRPGFGIHPAETRERTSQRDGRSFHSVVVNSDVGFLGVNMRYRRPRQVVEIITVHIDVRDGVFQLQAGISATRRRAVVVEELSVGDVVEPRGGIRAVDEYAVADGDIIDMPTIHAVMTALVHRYPIDENVRTMRQKHRIVASVFPGDVRDGQPVTPDDGGHIENSPPEGDVGVIIPLAPVDRQVSDGDVARGVALDHEHGFLLGNARFASAPLGKPFCQLHDDAAFAFDGRIAWKIQGIGKEIRIRPFEVNRRSGVLRGIGNSSEQLIGVADAHDSAGRFRCTVAPGD